MADSLEERLNRHARSFDGLLSLIPAKYYYGEDTSNQWKKKKQTKEEARQAKRAKLDPDSIQSAKDVLDMRAKKRKRDEDDVSSIEGVDLEQPKQGLKTPDEKQKRKKKKKTKSSKKSDDAEKRDEDDIQSPETKVVPEKVEQSRESTQNDRSQKEGSDAKVVGTTLRSALKKTADTEINEGNISNGHAETKEDDASIPVKNGEQHPSKPSENAKALVVEQSAETPTTVSPTPAADIPNFNDSGISVPSSSSSIVPPRSKERTVKKPLVDSETLRKRLNARIEELRAARHADGPDGKPARNRQELIEARRKKEEQRRAHKKEARQKAKEEERLARERVLALSRSPDVASPLGTPLSGPPDISSSALSFGRMAFKDGAEVDPNLNGVLDARRKKGPQDALGALKAAEAKQARLNGLDEQKQTKIAEQDMWLNARKRIHGEKVRDDTSLLKKTLKKQEKAKTKSETEWKDRLAGVEKGKEMRQKKREENLKKRRDEKGGGGNKANSKPKGKKRPGFEGTFRARTKG
ncbi:MAG: hypothetical protein M1823_003930 [Watsoniomyces obsoletus]|nr:MAG: hypothetical protein M1823_003930 [Watsoniomyces obsoletus]